MRSMAQRWHGMGWPSSRRHGPLPRPLPKAAAPPGSVWSKDWRQRWPGSGASARAMRRPGARWMRASNAKRRTCSRCWARRCHPGRPPARCGAWGARWVWPAWPTAPACCCVPPGTGCRTPSRARPCAACSPPGACIWTLPPTWPVARCSRTWRRWPGRASAWRWGKGGAEVVVRGRVGALRAAGGELRPGARVRRIHVAGGRAQSVELDDGQRIEARRAVIANVHPGALYGALLGAAAPPGSAQARDLRPGPATMMIHLALDALPAWRASTELQTFAYVHLAPSLQQMAQVYTQAMAGLLPHEPVLVVGQPTVFDPSRAPAGKHVLWVQVRVLPAKPCGDAAGQIAAAHWDDIKDAYAERVLDILERYAPGLRGSVLGRCVLSPADLERDNPNLVGGDSLSGSHHLDQFFLFRPAFGRSRWRPGVGGLFHIGASTWPGAGTGAASGYLLSRDLSDRAGSGWRRRMPGAGPRRFPAWCGGSAPRLRSRAGKLPGRPNP